MVVVVVAVGSLKRIKTFKEFKQCQSVEENPRKHISIRRKRHVRCLLATMLFFNRLLSSFKSLKFSRLASERERERERENY